MDANIVKELLSSHSKEGLVKITVETTVNAPIDMVWKAWNTPEDIEGWNAASEDWQTTSSKVDLKVGGKFSYRMEAKDGSRGFDFAGEYTEVVKDKLIQYDLENGRSVKIEFQTDGNSVKIIETFDAETSNDPELQRAGWQAILVNFKRHVESKSPSQNKSSRIKKDGEASYMKTAIEQFIESKVLPEYRPIIDKFRNLIKREFSDLKEEMRGGTEKYYGVPVYRNIRIIISVSPTKQGITFSFSDGKMINDKYSLLEGKGKKSLNLRISKIEDFDDEVFRYYIEQAIKIDNEK